MPFAGHLEHPVALEFDARGSLFVLNRGTNASTPGTATTNSGSLVRIRYQDLSDGNPASPVLEPPAVHLQVAMGLPGNPRDLPRTIRRTELGQRLAAAGSRWFHKVHGAWARGVREQNAIALPPGGTLKLTGSGKLIVPPGTVFVRNYVIHPAGAVFGNGKGQVTIETRLVVVGDPWGYGASYRWRPPNPTPIDEAEDADLVLRDELADVGPIWMAPHQGGPRMSQPVTWWFPGSDDRISWPSSNPAYYYPSSAGELIPLLRQFRDLFSPPLSTNAIAQFQQFRSWHEQGASNEEKVRSYLHGNCAVCHRPGGLAPGGFDARIGTPLADSGLIHGAPVAGNLGIEGAQIVVPGDPGKSLLYQRLVQPERHPSHPGISFQPDPPIAPMLESWIRHLKAD
ncbi:MAG: hypothetical protein J0L84_07790 [Verrucomicrobia bacterium]|nr:hypothetical protein [Verrucomicrobiota bacterium]